MIGNGCKDFATMHSCSAERPKVIMQSKLPGMVPGTRYDSSNQQMSRAYFTPRTNDTRTYSLLEYVVSDVYA